MAADDVEWGAIHGLGRAAGVPVVGLFPVWEAGKKRPPAPARFDPTLRHVTEGNTNNVGIDDSLSPEKRKRVQLQGGNQSGGSNAGLASA